MNLGITFAFIGISDAISEYLLDEIVEDNSGGKLLFP